MKKILFPVLICMIALLSACGGGGGSNVDSSYSKTIIQNGVTYECKSENAAALCDNGNCSSCESSLDKIITASCSTSISAGQTIFAVTKTGCVSNMKSGSRITAACDNGLLKLKVGSNFSLNQVINTGTTMSSGEYIVGTEVLRCGF